MFNKKKSKERDEEGYVAKDIILCRSGIQIYSDKEIDFNYIQGNPPKVKKDYYKEFRPADVIADAQYLCKGKPITIEHPKTKTGLLITDEDKKKYTEGTIGSDISIEGLGEGIIGIKADALFYTEAVYDYYKENKEVSLGYTCTEKWVDNPEEVGYDIEVVSIDSVNHLALTQKGRGGKSVRVLDSNNNIKGENNMADEKNVDEKDKDKKDEQAKDVKNDNADSKNDEKDKKDEKDVKNDGCSDKKDEDTADKKDVKTDSITLDSIENIVKRVVKDSLSEFKKELDSEKAKDEEKKKKKKEDEEKSKKVDADKEKDVKTDSAKGGNVDIIDRPSSINYNFDTSKLFN